MCEPVTIAMTVIAIAGAVKTQMDQKKAASVAAKNARAAQALEEEQALLQRAHQGDADAMRAFENKRASRVDEARIRTAAGEKGAATGNFQIDGLLQGLGFGTGLQNTADMRSATNNLETSAFQFRASGVNFNNRMRTIRSSAPTAIGSAFAIGTAGANAYVGAGGGLPSGSTTAPAGVSGGNQLNPRGGV